MKDIKIVAAVALVVLVVVFVLQNTEPVGIAFLAWTWSASRAFVLLVVFLLGVAVGWLSRSGTRPRR